MHRAIAVVLALVIAACSDSTAPPSAINAEGVWETDRLSLRLFDDNPEPSAEEGFALSHDLADGHGTVLVYWGTYTARSDSVFFAFQDDRQLTDAAWSDGTAAVLGDHVEMGTVRLVRTSDVAEAPGG